MTAKSIYFPLEESLVVINPAGDRVHILNPLARTVYEALGAGLNLAEIVSAIVGSDSNEERIRKEIEELLCSWQKEDLLDVPALPTVSKTEPPCAGDTIPSLEDLTGFTWANFRLHDLVFRIRSEDMTAWRSVMALYSHIVNECETDRPETVFSLEKGADESYRLVHDNAILNQADSLDTIIVALVSEIAELWHRRRDWLVIVHGAAIARNGKCILMAAQSGSGKSTLTATLLRHGFTYLADDIVPLCRCSGEAVALPICMNLKQGGVDLLRSLYPEIDDLHPYTRGQHTLHYLPPPVFQQAAPGHTLPVNKIIFPLYVKGTETTLTQISATESFQYLLEADPLLGMPLEQDRVSGLVQWIQERPAYTLQYDSLDEAVEVMLQL